MPVIEFNCSGGYVPLGPRLACVPVIGVFPWDLNSDYAEGEVPAQAPGSSAGVARGGQGASA